jgi:hypothetical protein
MRLKGLDGTEEGELGLPAHHFATCHGRSEEEIETVRASRVQLVPMMKTVVLYILQILYNE